MDDEKPTTWYLVDVASKVLVGATVIVGLIVWAARVQSQGKETATLLVRVEERLTRTEQRIDQNLAAIQGQLGRIEDRVNRLSESKP